MAYQRQTFINEETVLSAEMLEHIEDGIVKNENSIRNKADLDSNGKIKKEQIPDTTIKPLTINDTEYDGSEAVNVDTRDFVIDVTETVIDDTGNTEFSVDVTAEEILNAYNTGRTVVMAYDGYKIPLLMYDEAETFFVFAMPVGGLFTIMGVISLAENDIYVTVEQVVGTIKIGEQTADGDGPVDFTDTINGMIDDKFKPSVKSYGAFGDGTTDDTEAFRTALAENRLVYVPEGTYIISDTLTIEENCELELAQSAVLNFTQTDKPCITLLRLASLKGNHATINVPYEFSSSVINSSTEDDINSVPDTNGDGDKVDENAFAVPPFTKWSPQWKMSRYVTNINICKTMGDTNLGTYAGFHYSQTGDTKGSAVSMVCRTVDYPVGYMWGILMSGVRIAGAFTYGIYINNEGESWNHDMRIEAVIDGCKVAVYANNCHIAHLDVTFQPRPAHDGTVYAEKGVELHDCKWIDLSRAFIWDWNATNTLCDESVENRPVAMYGECVGLVLSIPYYYEGVSNINQYIYSDNEDNLEKMVLLQRMGNSKWFKNEKDKPYFFDGGASKQIALINDLENLKITSEQTHFISKATGEYVEVPSFTDKKAPYVPNAWNNSGTMVTLNGSFYIEPRPIAKGSVVRIQGLNFEATYPYNSFFYVEYIDNNGDTALTIDNLRTKIATNKVYSGDLFQGFGSYVWDKATKTLTVTIAKDTMSTGGVSFGFCSAIADGFTADSVIMTVNEEIKYDKVWQGNPKTLDPSIKVNSENISLKSPNGTLYKIAVNDDGTLSTIIQ